jgi:hypothetical protein
MRSIAGRKTDAIAKFSRHGGSKIAETTTQVKSRQPGSNPQTTDPVGRFSRPLAARLPVSLSSLAADCCSDNRPTPDSAGAEESPAPGISAPPQILRSLTNPHANRQNPPIPPTRPLIRTAPREMNVRSSAQAQRLHPRFTSKPSGDRPSPFSPAQAGNHETSDYGRSRIHWQSYR